MTSVLIVGCGVFGLATSLELAQKGYKVTAIDVYEPPSPWSAACDYNKIIRAEYDEEIYTALSVEAIEMWKNDATYKGTYNNCGRVMITPAHFVARREFEKKGIENLQSLGKGLDIEYYIGGKELAKNFEYFEKNSLGDDEQLKFNPYGGLAHSSNAMVAVYNEAKKLGVKFMFGDDGFAKSAETINGKSYIVTKSGLKLTADKIIVSSGANTASIVNLQNQQSATGLFVTFIKLSDSEYEKFKNCPVLFDAEMGYFFPPDPQTKLLKIALPGSGACNLTSNPHSPDGKISLPRYKNLNPDDTIPKTGEREVRSILLKYVPELSNHKLIDSKICWVGDTQDSNFIIDKIPGFDNLYVASGDSGHGLKFLPNIGKYIVQKLEGKLNPTLNKMWKWKDGNGFDPANCSWRLGDEYPDIKDMDFRKEMDAKL